MAAAEQRLLGSSHTRVLGVPTRAHFVQTVGREKTTLPSQAHFWGHFRTCACEYTVVMVASDFRGGCLAE